MPMVDTATRGTATVKLTIPVKSGTLTSEPLHGCFVKKDANLETFVDKLINILDPSADRNKFRNSEYLFYSTVNNFQGKVTKAVIDYEKISKKLCTKVPKKKTKTCEVDNPLVIAFDWHFFLCCDSEDLKKSTFLEKHSKEVKINQTLDPSKSFYGLGMESDSDCNYLKFIPFNMSQCGSQINIYEIKRINKNGESVLNKLKEAGPLLLDNTKTIVGCYRKSNSNCRIEIFKFGKSQGTGQAADTQPPAAGEGTGQAADTQPPAAGEGTGQGADTQPPAAGDETEQAGESDRVPNSSPPNSPGDNQQSDVQDDRSSDNSDGISVDDEQQDAPPHNAHYSTEEQGSKMMPNDQPNLPNGYTLADLFKRKTSVLNGLCLRLDNDYKIIQNWRELADHLNAPDGVKTSCECSKKHSPTELLLEVPDVFSVTITELLQKLGDMQRNDVVLKITDKISEADRNKTVYEMLINHHEHHELYGEVALLLDKDSSGRNNNWRKLGQKLGVSRDNLDLIGRGNNPTNKLFLYAYATLEREKLKAGYFRSLIEKFPKRTDVKNFLDTLQVTLQDVRSIMEVFPLESDNLGKLCGFLNRNAGGAVKDWKYLASAWKIEYDIYISFDDTEKQSPTKMLLEWLIQARPGFTVEELRTFLKAMKRNDVREYLENEASG